MHSSRVACVLALLTGLTLIPARAEPPHYGLGTTPSAAEIAGWNIDIRGDGQGLPPGSGSVEQGRDVYAEHCVMCHGDKGQGGPAPKLVGGIGTLATAHPIQTIGSYWPYATTLFDYIRRAMPFNAPESLTNDQVYAVSAYLLWLNGIVPEQIVLNAENLPKVVMPNRGGFTSPDPRPDVP
jgi:S-disulfanyl-L-cysteine oxidoreductase SoxD